MSPEWEIAFLLSFSLYQIQIMSILKYICRHFCEWIYSNVYLLKNTHPKYFWVHYSNDRKQKLQKTTPLQKKPHPSPPPKNGLCNSEREYFISFRTSLRTCAASGPPLRARALQFVRLCSQAWVPISERGLSAGKRIWKQNDDREHYLTLYAEKMS